MPSRDSSGRPRARPLVLIVDDNLQWAMALERQLRHDEVDVDVDIATSLAEALEKMDKREYDLVLADCQLPDSGDCQHTVYTLAQRRVVVVPYSSTPPPKERVSMREPQDISAIVQRFFRDRRWRPGWRDVWALVAGLPRLAWACIAGLSLFVAGMVAIVAIVAGWDPSEVGVLLSGLLGWGG